MNSGPEFFAYHSFMVELYWLPCIHLLQARQERGVYVFMTTNVSNSSTYCSDWAVFFLPGARESWIVGDTYGHELGRVGDVYPNAGQSSMSAFLALQYPDILPYHAWVGYSNNTATMDQQYHCLDFYWQSPQEYRTGSYHWFLLLDVSDPSGFYLSVVYKRVGIKSMKDPERPNYIRRANM